MPHIISPRRLTSQRHIIYDEVVLRHSTAPPPLFTPFICHAYYAILLVYITEASLPRRISLLLPFYTQVTVGLFTPAIYLLLCHIIVVYI